jgi:integrase
VASLRKKGRVWYVRIRDESGRQREVKAGPDKSVAQSIARDLESKTQRVKAGVLDPREAGCLDAERIPIQSHADDFVRNLASRGCVTEHVDGVKKRLQWLLDESRITRLSQLVPSVAEDAIKVLRDGHRSPRTLAHYVAAWKGFTRWLRKNKRTKEDLLEDLERPEVPESEGIALTAEQATRLVSATRSGKVRRGMSGEDRAWLYLLAMYTGFRRGELQALTPEFFALDNSPATVTLKGNVKGQLTKNRKRARQPLPAHIIPELRTWLAGKPPGVAIFPHDQNSSTMIKGDLKSAGIPSDEITFHSLRHCYATFVDQSGASTKEAMKLARHSDPRLTLNRYTHTQMEELSKVVDKLPELWEKSGKGDGLSIDAKSKTGKGDAIHQESLAPDFPTPGLWERNRIPDSSHTLPTSGVSSGLNGTIANPVKHGPRASQADPSRHAFELPGQDSNLEKQDQNLL